MAKVFVGRFTAQISTQIEGPFVLLLLGIRVNYLFMFWKWVPTVLASLPMVFALVRKRAPGFLGGQAYFFNPGLGIVQFWRSFDDLEKFARNKKLPHIPGWRWYNKAIGTGGSVGLWHEAYLVLPTDQEAMYDNMPVFGLAAGVKHLAAKERREAARFNIGSSVLQASEERPE